MEEDSVDLIFCTEVIEHIDNNIQLFENFHRFLKKTVKIFLTTTTFYYYIGHLLTSYLYRDILRKKDLKVQSKGLVL